ncbi:MAG: hypothetical protein KAJ14_04265 [Candidatus Omnitrophica bacterium]|nr:hypothetical protein [Candidatus Omnitrophota bacterium]
MLKKKGFIPTSSFLLSKSDAIGNNKKKKSLMWGFTPNTFGKKVWGFTVLEILIVISILLIIISIVVSPFSSFRNRSVLNAEVENIITLLSEARTKTLASLDDSEYGVHFEANRAVFFKGNLFTEPDSNNKEIIFDQAVYISNISLTGAGVNVIFNRLIGKTDEDGTITIELTSDSTTNNVIHIYPTGSMEIK